MLSWFVVMGRTLAYENVESALVDFSYPVLRDDVAAELADVVVTFEDGREANLGVLVSETDSDAFHEPGDICEELEQLAQRVPLK